MTAPSISAIVRVHDGEAHVGQTLEAILAQTHPADEIVVVDDGSTDRTPEILARFGAQLHVVRQPNGGLAAAFNRAMAEARGEYVAICDADDLWVPEKLARQAAAVAAHPEVDLAFGAAWIFGAGSGPWGYLPVREPGVVAPGRFLGDLFRDNVVTTSTVLIRRRLVERLGPFEEHNGAEDYDYWLRAVRAGATVYYDPGTLVRYRRHAAQVTGSALRMWESGLEVRELHAGRLRDRALVGAVLADNHFRVGRLLVDAGRPRAARPHFAACARRPGAAGPQRARALAWVAVLALPPAARERAGRSLVGLSRRVA